MTCDCEPVSMRDIADRTGSAYETVKAWHYKRDEYRWPKLVEPQWPGKGDGGDGPRWCWAHQLQHLHSEAEAVR